MSLENQPPSPQGDRIDREKLTFLWGMDPLPMSDTPAHFLVLGGVGSGKTITLRLLMQSVINAVGFGLDHRVLVYDPMRNMGPSLRGLNLRCPVCILNPFDQQAAAWDIAADISSPVAAWQMATYLIPEDRSSSPFFADAARQLLLAVLLRFHNVAPGKWTLRDVLLAMRNRERILSLLAGSPTSADSARLLMNDERTSLGILDTIATRLQRLEVIAACWQHATKKLSLERWVGEESVILLEGNIDFHSSIAPIHQLFLARLSELLGSQSDSAGRRTWVFLDDICAGGRLDMLPALMQQGRSKGVCIAFGVQSLGEIRRLYGSQAADQLLAACSHKTALQTHEPEAASWAEQDFGQPLLMGDLMSLPGTGPEHGFAGFHRTPTAATHFTHKPWDWVLEHLPPFADTAPDESLRPASEHHLQDWTDEDYQRLGCSIRLPDEKPAHR